MTNAELWENLPAILAALESGWMPVTVSLPPENVRVQVWFGDHEHADHAMLFDGNWINGNWHHYLPLNESGITHWRHITPPTTAKENR